jgi:guanine nucleotide-binding protein subunit alpha
MKTTVIAVIKKMKACTPPPGLKAVEHEEFENACYMKFAGVDTVASPCKAPAKGEEFNPFAANPVHHRWFKGITLYTKEVTKAPDKGVYLGIFKVCSSTDGFKIMVNEHNRISIPMIFLTENQLTPEEVKWMHGVRIREDQFKIDLLEGKQPNRGWLGPEMSGEEGATFPEKLWWAIDEAKARLDTQTIGFQYDRELLFIDEKNNIQLLLFGMLAKDEQDLLPGHIWVSRETLEVQNMKYNCPVVLQAMLNETQGKINEYQALVAQDADNWDAAKKLRAEKDKIKETIENLYESKKPLKWVNRVIMWCAEKMPSFGAGIEGKDANEVVEKAMANNAEMDANNEQRSALIKKYQNQTA